LEKAKIYNQYDIVLFYQLVLMQVCDLRTFFRSNDVERNAKAFFGTATVIDDRMTLTERSLTEESTLLMGVSA
jgi:hypothetical protein